MTSLWLMLDVMAKKGRVKTTYACLEPSKKLCIKVKSNIEYVEVIKKYFLGDFLNAQKQLKSTF